MTNPRNLADWALAFLERRLEMKLAALRLATSDVAQAMLREYTAQLDAVRLEIARRAQV